MKNKSNISAFLKKLLSVVAVVLLLSACSENDPAVVGEVDVSDKACLSCEILELMYNAVSKNVMDLHAVFTGAAMPIMMVGFSIWLALRLLKFVSSVTETNAGEVWNEIVRKAFLCLLCGMLASSSGALLMLLNMIIFPIYHAFMELGIDLLNNSIQASKEQPQNITVFGTQLLIEGVKFNCEIDGELKATEAGFPDSLRDAMSCMIRALSAYLSIGGEIATKVMGHKGFMGKVLGAVLFVFFWVVKLGFSFYLVDMIFQMGIIILLLPFYVLSYAFGPTQKWAKKGFSHILASSAFLMCFSVIVALVLMAMISLVKENPSIFHPDDTEANMKDVSIGFMCLLLIGFLVYGSMGVSQQLTSALIGAKVSADFQKKLKAAVQGVGGAILNGIGSLITWGMSLAPYSSSRIIRTIGKANDKVKAYRATMHRLAGRKSKE